MRNAIFTLDVFQVFPNDGLTLMAKFRSLRPRNRPMLANMSRDGVITLVLTPPLPFRLDYGINGMFQVQLLVLYNHTYRIII